VLGQGVHELQSGIIGIDAKHGVRATGVICGLQAGLKVGKCRVLADVHGGVVARG